MPKFSANLSLMYTEHDFLDRFEAAAQDGFKAVEFLFPYAWPAAEIKARLAANGLQLALFNAPPGGHSAAEAASAWASGARGSACLPGREAEFAAGITLALRYADALACPRIHAMAGLLPPEQLREALQPLYVRNLRWAAQQAAPQGVQVLIEPINTRDMPRYFLNRQDHAHELLDAAGADNLKVQMDLYHCQISEGDVATKLAQYLPTGRVAHLQIAGVPQRQEPGTGELNYAYLLALVDTLAAQTGWDGWVGCEYRPAQGTRAGLGWREPWLFSD
ncbi:MAG: 2-oxo-tetronate isomerase, partial [Burkholderiaceae bacterium]